MKTERFSKASVTETIARHITVENDGYDFNIRLGWYQVQKAAQRKAHSSRPVTGDDLRAAHRAFGAFEALHALAEELGLSLDVAIAASAKAIRARRTP